MLKKFKKILSIFMLAIVFISNTSSIIKAAYEYTESYIEQIGEAPYHLKYYNESKGMYTYSICAIVGHYENGTFYPAYCLNRDLNGVGKVAGYTVDVDSIITDNKVWRAVKNGYPYKSASEMGLESDFDAFAVTKFAVYCLTGQADVNLYIADEGDEEGQAMLRALHKLVDIGLNGGETFKDELKITSLGEFEEEDEFYSLAYKVTAGASISNYTIKSVTGLEEGDLITDEEGNIRTEFKSGENFKVKILKSHSLIDKDIDIKIEAKLKNYPMFYGKTRISGTQNYLLTANSYQNIETQINSKFIAPKKGNVIITKVDKDNLNIALGNVEFELYNEKNELIGKYYTDSNGKIQINDLIIGKYMLKETSTNEWYNLAEDTGLEIKWNETTEKTIENELKKSQIKIIKVDREDNKIKIPGVVFEVQDLEGNVLEEITTNKEGVAYTQKYALRDYKKLRLKEVKTDEMYVLNDEIKEIELKENQITEIKFENEKKKNPEEEIIKTGEELAKANDEIEYKINVKNTGDVPLDNFTWEDNLPTDYIRLKSINTGTFNQQTTYNLYYKTNLREDYTLFMEDISSYQNEEIDLSQELQENEYITSIKLEFGTVDVGFQSEIETSLFAKVNSNVKRDDIFENTVTLTSDYKGEQLVKDSKWKTKIYEILPVTGM